MKMTQVTLRMFLTLNSSLSNLLKMLLLRLQIQKMMSYPLHLSWFSSHCMPFKVHYQTQPPCSHPWRLQSHWSPFLSFLTEICLCLKLALTISGKEASKTWIKRWKHVRYCTLVRRELARSRVECHLAWCLHFISTLHIMFMIPFSQAIYTHWGYIYKLQAKLASCEPCWGARTSYNCSG